MIYAKIVLDSENCSGNRLTTFEVAYPAVIHPEVVAHRMLSVSLLPDLPRFEDWVAKDPTVPAHVHPALWLAPLEKALEIAKIWLNEGTQVGWRAAHQLLTPWRTDRALISATEFDHFFQSYGSADFMLLAMAMKQQKEESIPKLLRDSEWHLPYTEFVNRDNENYISIDQRDKLLQISIGRCARKIPEIHDELVRARDFSFFEHLAQALGEPRRVGNFVGWKQYRKLFQNEYTGRLGVENPPVDTGYTPLYARMEAAFREELLSRPGQSEISDNYLREFFPRDAERVLLGAAEKA